MKLWNAFKADFIKYSTQTGFSWSWSILVIPALATGYLIGWCLSLIGG